MVFLAIATATPYPSKVASGGYLVSLDVASKTSTPDIIISLAKSLHYPLQLFIVGLTIELCTYSNIRARPRPELLSRDEKIAAEVTCTWPTVI